MNILDIGYKKEGLEQKLSNLYPHSFHFDGIDYKSFEGFLQSLKYQDTYRKSQIYKLFGYEAWHSGHVVNWDLSMNLFYKETIVNRHSDEYRVLINSAYDALSENIEFNQCLIDSIGCKLIHTIGRTDPNKTILTNAEFLGNLNRLRDKLKPQRFHSLF